ncbi:ribosome recycling factor [Spirosomataceae bacterium TFI 002]|nr:ribosome recycling factor [Spirosomataceae bacterium TFI 002]
MEEIEMILDMARESMDKALSYTASELRKIRAGKANTQMVEGVSIDYYGVPTPINQASSVTTPDARTIAIRPFERGILNDIERAIINANLGFAPSNDGETIRINIPPLTEERRLDLVKMVKNEIETARINTRKVRQESNDELRKLKNEGVSEDAIKIGEERVQKLTDEYVDKTESMFKAKEKDIMSV